MADETKTTGEVVSDMNAHYIDPAEDQNKVQVNID